MKPKQRKTYFVSKVGRLSEIYIRVTMDAVVKHEWQDANGTRWAVVVFNDTPYLACEEDVR